MVKPAAMQAVHDLNAKLAALGETVDDLHRWCLALDESLDYHRLDVQELLTELRTLRRELAQYQWRNK